MTKSTPQSPLTKRRFEALLKKAAQLVSEWKHVPKETETSVDHPSDDYSGKRKSRGKIGDKEG